MYHYSPGENLFYPTELQQDYINAGTWPSDGIAVNEAMYREYRNPPEGKRRIAGTDGLPAWGDIPPPTPEELQRRAERQKQYRMTQASNAIAPLQDAVDLNMATDAEKSALTAWRKYRVLLNRVDCSTTPDIQWPEQPK
ncbi:tail fiber assembly protein [Xenorhabdus ishibashii]|uniref:Phage tail fiber assembly n=1 Tax=Xenorhabdus ishibashii TaxID=1034471 RepID=A0A2D0KCP8_9GAMM|nr:tail fiber assembly protein [Xenorhabdus ishibashii]PHM61160.1 phage tail fiber assembly [Xenorhabdus ishibashii]